MIKIKRTFSCLEEEIKYTFYYISTSLKNYFLHFHVTLIT